MTPETSLLLEVWETVKGQIHEREQDAIAQEIIECFDNNVSMEDWGSIAYTCDETLKNALNSYFEEDDEDDDDDDFNEYD